MNRRVFYACVGAVVTYVQKILGKIDYVAGFCRLGSSAFFVRAYLVCRVHAYIHTLYGYMRTFMNTYLDIVVADGSRPGFDAHSDYLLLMHTVKSNK